MDSLVFPEGPHLSQRKAARLPKVTAEIANLNQSFKGVTVSQASVWQGGVSRVNKRATHKEDVLIHTLGWQPNVKIIGKVVGE